MTKREPLLCSAIPFGYGPSAKLVALAQGLREDGPLVFVGRGTALELAARSRDLFDEVVSWDADSRRVVRLASRAWGVLSLMDRDVAALAARAGKPLFVVDSLLWMRPCVPHELRHARVYWAQRFPGLGATGYEPRPTLVGPLVAECRERERRRRAGLVVHLGGSAAPRSRGSLYERYAEFVARGVLEADLLGRFGSLLMLGGDAVISQLTGAFSGVGWRFASLSHGEARRELAGAEAVLTAPGLTTALECFHDRTPTWFLPPQNYSQWLILRSLRAARVAVDALHWEDLEGVMHLPNRMPAEARDPIVCQTIERFTTDGTAAARLGRGLARVGAAPDARVAAQRAFFTSLGPPGMKSIATALRRARSEGTVPKTSRREIRSTSVERSLG